MDHGRRSQPERFFREWVVEQSSEACLVFVASIALVLMTGGPNQWTPMVPLAALITFVGCTISSIWWEKLYREELLREDAQ